MLFTDDPYNTEIVYTLRAKHLSNHPGEVAFPGGMWEPQDKSLLATALREGYEEVGLYAETVTLLGACSPRSTRAGVWVTPFVGVIPADTELLPNPAELDAVFRVPLAAFHSGAIHIRTDIFSQGEQSWQIPAYQHQGYEIWGFTAALTHEVISSLVQTAGEIALIE